MATPRHMTTTAIALAVGLLAIAAIPASAGTSKVAGVGVFNDACAPPSGAPPADLGDYPPLDLTGTLDGCWYTYVSTADLRPSGAYQETGAELFVGCLSGTGCGTFRTTYRFTGKFAPSGDEIHGRCHHAVVGGTGAFSGATGEIQFHDDVDAGIFAYGGSIRTGGLSAQYLAARKVAASAGSGGC